MKPGELQKPHNEAEGASKGAPGGAQNGAEKAVSGAGNGAAQSEAAPDPRAESTPRRRMRGRRRLRTPAQVRGRHNEIADQVVSGELGAKEGAVAIQALGGVLACLRVERDEEILKRLEAVEAKIGKGKKRHDYA